MKIYPKLYCEKITDITVEYLKENNIKALILDVDNTLLDFDLKFIEGLEAWHNNIKENNIKSIILSNSNKTYKVKMAAELLNIPFIQFATKPLKRGFKKAQKNLEIPNENIAVIGDQIFTDVIGANRCNMHSILVKPIAEKDLFLTRIKRPIENLVIKRYLKKQVGK
jgi:HAD superfamily phosphatase (TIGR01668 family)